jgi:hypothetical protein
MSRAAHREATRDCDEPNGARVAANDTLARLLKGGIRDSGRGEQLCAVAASSVLIKPRLLRTNFREGVKCEVQWLSLAL